MVYLHPSRVPAVGVLGAAGGVVVAWPGVL